MVKSPGGSPHNQRFRRTPPRHTMPETAKPAVVRQPAKQPAPAKRTLDALRGGLRKLRSVIQAQWIKISTLAGRLIRKMLLSKDAPRAGQRAYAARRLRFIVCAGSAMVVIVVLLFVLLAPGGSAASVSGPTASATPTATPIPTTAPDPVETFFPTTEPDPVITPPPATPKPTEKPTPKPTAKPTATPKPTAKPTATPKPTEEPTATPVPTAEPTPPPAQSTSSGSTDMNSMVSYFVVSADTYYNEVGYYTNHYNYTDEELTVLARIMQIEAGSKNGMIAVGNVIMNRVLCGRFGSNITAVVTAKNQFAYNPAVTPKQSAIDAAHAVLDDEVWLVPQNAYFFKGSGTEGESWSGRAYCATIGGNYFYTYNYGGRYNGTGVPPALFDRTYKHAQYGCKPEDRVYRIQFMLQSLSYSVSPDRYFGKGTKDALIAFQQSKGLTADGVAGPATIEALINAYGVDNYIAKFAS